MSPATGLDRRQARRRKREAWRNWQEVERLRALAKGEAARPDMMAATSAE